MLSKYQFVFVGLFVLAAVIIASGQTTPEWKDFVEDRDRRALSGDRWLVLSYIARSARDGENWPSQFRSPGFALWIDDRAAGQATTVWQGGFIWVGRGIPEKTFKLFDARIEDSLSIVVYQQLGCTWCDISSWNGVNSPVRLTRMPRAYIPKYSDFGAGIDKAEIHGSFFNNTLTVVTTSEEGIRSRFGLRVDAKKELYWQPLPDRPEPPIDREKPLNFRVMP